MELEVRPEHRWLQRMVGEWRYETTGEEAPDGPQVMDTGTETVRALGDVWVVFEGRSEADAKGASAATMMTLGYDPQRGRFVGTFIGIMMTYQWVYEGDLDAGGDAVALYSEGPSFAEEGKMALYRDTMELRGDDERVFTSHYQVADGAWRPFMTTRYRRVKQGEAPAPG